MFKDINFISLNCLGSKQEVVQVIKTWTNAGTTRQSLEKIVEAFQKNHKRIRETCFKSEPERGLDAMTYITLFEFVKLSICQPYLCF